MQQNDAPVFGRNAKPFFIQTVVGLIVAFAAYEFGLWDFLMNLSCRYITGSCL